MCAADNFFLLIKLSVHITSLVFGVKYVRSSCYFLAVKSGGGGQIFSGSREEGGQISGLLRREEGQTFLEPGQNQTSRSG